MATDDLNQHLKKHSEHTLNKHSIQKSRYLLILCFLNIFGLFIIVLLYFCYTFVYVSMCVCV